MNIKYTNGLYTFIGILPEGIDLPDNFVYYEGTLEEQFFKIKKHEFKTNTMYQGHFIYKKSDLIYEPEFFSHIVSKNPLQSNNVFFKSVDHRAKIQEKAIDDSMVYCSSWVLPFVSEVKRTSNTLYGNLMMHRVNMSRLKTPFRTL
jgi:hypothetical protein